MTEPSSSGMRRRMRRSPARLAIFLAIFLLFAAAAGVLVMLLWNAVVVPALGARPIGIWQALGLLLLCRVLFGAWSRPRRFGPRSAATRQHEAGVSMSSEQRASFRDHWRARCSGMPARKKEEGDDPR